jgi:hypothetical protein
MRTGVLFVRTLCLGFLPVIPNQSIRCHLPRIELDVDAAVGRDSDRFVSLQSDPDQPMRLFPGTTHNVEVERKCFTCGRRRIFVWKMVDHSFNANRLPRRKQTPVNRTSDIEIRRGIHHERHTRSGPAPHRDKRPLASKSVWTSVSLELFILAGSRGVLCLDWNKLIRLRVFAS